MMRPALCMHFICICIMHGLHREQDHLNLREIRLHKVLHHAIIVLPARGSCTGAQVLFTIHSTKCRKGLLSFR